MPPEILLLAIVIVAIAIFFSFTNGFHDAANQVATIIASRALSPFAALGLTAIFNFIGAYTGTAVAATIGKNIIDASIIQTNVEKGIATLCAALVGAIIWNLITWKFGIPSSSSHTLIGGLVGAFLAAGASDFIYWKSVFKIVVIMIATPFIGFFITYLFTRLTLIFSQWSSPRINTIFRKLQIFSSITQAFSSGANDAQKIMGVLVLSLTVLGIYSGGEQWTNIPQWIIIASALPMAIGMVSGGRKIIKKLGMQLYKIRPIHGFASQMASTITIYLATLSGFPVSTTQVISSSIMGAGAAFRPKMVRWQVAEEMFVVWFITIPASALAAAFSFFIIKILF
ncbi:MAG: inorganic phosphate transporter [Parcubacteria group bacterium]|nr:inorganic phosphate transporter [Parcubacteria group bacterium]